MAKQTVESDLEAMWSLGSTTLPSFHVLLGPFESRGIKNVRASFEMQNSTGDAQVNPAVEMSNDGETWDTLTDIGSDTRNTNGTTNGSSYNNLSSTMATKRYARAGLKVVNVSGSTIAHCRGKLRLEFED